MAHADDELLSALLDGESALGDIAHVDTCNECQARLTELRGAATALATPVTPPPGHVREAAFREALLEVNGTPKLAGARVLPFGRRSPAIPSRRRNPFSAAAALLVAVLIGAWALSTIGGGDNAADDTGLATGASSAIESSAGALDLAKDAAAPAPSGIDGGHLGAVDDITAVQHAYEAATTRSDAATITHCPIPDGASLLFHAELTYKGETAVAHIVQIAEAQPSTRILRLPGCSLIASQELAPTSPH